MAGSDVSEQDGLPDNLKARIAKSYDAIAETYGAWTEQHFDSRLAALDVLLPRLKDYNSPITILELGCGGGLPVMKTILEQLDINYIANDISSKQIEIARKNIGSELEQRVRFIEGDMFNIHLEDQSLDAVIAMYSIIHLPREEQVQLLRKIYAWLKPGGLLLANFGTEDMAQATNPHWLHEDGWMFWSGWGAERTIAKLKDVGFDVLHHWSKKDVADATFLWVLGMRK